MLDNEESLITDITVARIEADLSIRQLGGIIGVSFSTLARIERGEGRPSLETRVALLGWLGRDATREQEQLSMQGKTSLATRVATLEASVQALTNTIIYLQGKLHTMEFPLD